MKATTEMSPREEKAMSVQSRFRKIQPIPWVEGWALHVKLSSQAQLGKLLSTLHAPYPTAYVFQPFNP